MIPIEPATLAELAQRHGGDTRHASGAVRALARPNEAKAEELAPLFSLRYLADAEAARARGAHLLVAQEIAGDPRVRALGGWVVPHAAWTLAELLDGAKVASAPPVIGEGSIVEPGAHLHPRVVLGQRVHIGAGAVIGAPGFGWASRERPGSEQTQVRQVPQKGGVILEDDVWIGALTTVDAGTLGPTVVRRGAKIDAQVHVGHNCEIGEGVMIAAQTGLAGSVRVGRGARLGGQVGIADHVEIGEGARVAAKSGVIGDVPPFAVVAGYPALARARWLRGLAAVFKRK